jgi:hypothetical protein
MVFQVVFDSKNPFVYVKRVIINRIKYFNLQNRKNIFL